MKLKDLFSPIILIAAAAGAAYYIRSAGAGTALELSGTIEARNIRVGSKVGGRVAEVLAREGDRVEAGQVLLTFEDDELEAALQQAQASLRKLENGYRPEEIAEARAAASRAAAELEELRSGYRTEQVAAARAELERMRAEVDRARITYERTRQLADQGVFSRQQHDRHWQPSAPPKPPLAAPVSVMKNSIAVSAPNRSWPRKRASARPKRQGNCSSAVIAGKTSPLPRRPYSMRVRATSNAAWWLLPRQ
jgi:multidrug efflux pump subunit AcrA (membrane-fusion protein)